MLQTSAIPMWFPAVMMPLEPISRGMLRALKPRAFRSIVSIVYLTDLRSLAVLNNVRLLSNTTVSARSMMSFFYMSSSWMSGAWLMVTRLGGTVPLFTFQPSR